ncbi:MAG TPA: GtrA family protein [Terriglobia bacterium]|nr:GtrA family protein [Terriglobia bacterium]
MIFPGKAAFYRWLKFNAVGLMGTAVQLGMLAILIRVLAVHFILATALAIETSVIHNFLWHWRWTWADRHTGGLKPMAATLLRFNLSNGMISLIGTILCTGILTGMAHVDPILANILSFIPCWIINYLVSDRLVFLSQSEGEA